MMDAKLMVDIATCVMEEYGIMCSMNERNTKCFCEKLEAAFKEAAAGAPDLRSAILALSPDLPMPNDGGNALRAEGFDNGIHAAAALVSAAPVEALTDEEIASIAKTEGFVHVGQGGYRFARAIEARIKGGAK